MPDASVKKKPEQASGFQHRLPELEKSIRNVTRELAGANLTGDRKTQEQLQRNLSDLIKEREKILASTPRRVEGGEKVGVAPQGGVEVKFEDGRAGYAQRQKLPELFDEQPRKAPKMELRHAP